MKIKFLQNKNFHKGFTLIELLIVIAILGILAAALMVAINPAQKIAASKNARVKSDLSSIGSQASIFNTDTGTSGTGSYPNTWGATSGSFTFMTATAPKDPSGNAYAIQINPAGCTPAGTACTSISVNAPAYADANAVPAVAAGTVWCWQSKSGSITNQANAAACTP